MFDLIINVLSGPDIAEGFILVTPLGLERVGLYPPGDQDLSVMDHPGLRLLPGQPRPGVRPQPLPECGDPGEQLVDNSGRVNLLRPHGRLATKDQGL